MIRTCASNESRRKRVLHGHGCSENPASPARPSIGVREYWAIDRFRRRLTVYRFIGEKDEGLSIPEDQTYETPLLPGFVLPLKRLLASADRWAKQRRR
jgi:hypothetical protein